jgi:hypothetical protein
MLETSLVVTLSRSGVNQCECKQMVCRGGGQPRGQNKIGATYSHVFARHIAVFWNSIRRKCHVVVECTRHGQWSLPRNGSLGDCDRTALTPQQASKVIAAEHQRNFSECQNGLETCDYSKLTPSEAETLAIAEHWRNYAACLKGLWLL